MMFLAIGPDHELRVVRVDATPADGRKLVQRFAERAFAGSKGKMPIAVSTTDELEEPLPSGRPQEDVQLRGGETRLEGRVWREGSWTDWRKI